MLAIRKLHHLIFIFFLFAANHIAHGAQPLWTFSEPFPRITTVDSASQPTVSYVVTNQSSKSKHLYLKPQPGVSTNSDCILAAKGSTCILVLTIHGSQIPAAGIKDGPTFCESRSANQCYRPSAANVLTISRSDVSTYTIGGTISGLVGDGLVLQNNASENLSIASGAMSFQFPTPVAFGGSYSVTVAQQPVGQTCTVSNGAGTNVMGDVSNVSITCSAITYTISGSITGLTSSGLVLRNNGGDDLSVANGVTSFQFPTPVAFGGSYSVTVAQQPTGLTCTVSNGTGINVMANISNVSVTCNVTTYTVGGSVSGLTSNGLVLRNNGGDDLSVANGATSFQFPTPVAFGGSYSVTVAQQPVGRTCSVSNATGTNVMANISNVSVTCNVTTYTIGGSVSGLTSNGLVLRNNGGDDLSVANGATSFQFPTPVAFGGSYSVTVAQQPTGLTCTVSNEIGSNVMANISNVSVTCSAPTNYTIGGSISNLTSSGLVLLNNGGDPLFPAPNSNSFTFPQPVTAGGSYSVTVAQQPTGQTCSVSAGSGTATSNVTTVSISCDGANPQVFVSEANVVTTCGVTQFNTFTNCQTAGFFNSPVGIALSSDGNRAYVAGGNQVMKCTVNGDGTFNSCSSTGSVFMNTWGIFIAANGYAYVTDTNLNQVLKCNVDGFSGDLFSCASTGTGFNLPTSVYVTGNRAYVTNSTSVRNCTVNGDGSFGLCVTVSGLTSSNNSGIVLNALGTRAYVTNAGTSSVISCAVSGSTGQIFGSCQTNTGFSNPQGIVLNAAGTQAFVANLSANSVLSCTVNGGLVNNCNVAGMFQGPFGIALKL